VNVDDAIITLSAPFIDKVVPLVQNLTPSPAGILRYS